MRRFNLPFSRTRISSDWKRKAPRVQGTGCGFLNGVSSLTHWIDGQERVASGSDGVDQWFATVPCHHWANLRGRPTVELIRFQNSGTPSGMNFIAGTHTGGLRVAATSGYSLATFQVAAGSDQPEGLKDSSRGLSKATPPDTGMELPAPRRGVRQEP